MSRKNFQDLLSKYAEGLCTPEEKATVEQWYDLLDDDAIPEIKEEEISNIEIRLWEKVKSTIKVPVKKAAIRQLWVKWVAAAGFIGLIMLGYFLYNPPAANEWIANEVQKNLKEKSNTTNQPLTINLEDGSMVTLQPGATLSYPEHFAQNTREVYLNGEAFFEIQKNIQKPFFVYNKEIITQVLGTSFSVKPVEKGSKVEISVRTGRVSVIENTKTSGRERNTASKGIVLIPNQKGIYVAKQAMFQTTIADSPVPLINESIVFDDESLSKVIATFKRVYGIDILVNNNNLYKCPVTGDFNKQSFYTQLDLICRAINASFEVKATTILIKGKGCN